MVVPYAFVTTSDYRVGGCLALVFPLAIVHPTGVHPIGSKHTQYISPFENISDVSRFRLSHNVKLYSESRSLFSICHTDVSKILQGYSASKTPANANHSANPTRGQLTSSQKSIRGPRPRPPAHPPPSPSSPAPPDLVPRHRPSSPRARSWCRPPRTRRRRPRRACRA